MKFARPIVLVGLRGVGKSTVGPLVARELGLGFVDLDECIQFSLATECCNLHAPTIAELVREHGWEEFRERESAELQRVLSDGQARVVAAGGGVVERESNRRSLRERALVVWLRDDPERLAARTRGDDSRPALTDLTPDEEWRQIAARRTPWFAETATLEIEVEGRSPAMLARCIVDALADPSRRSFTAEA